MGRRFALSNYPVATHCALLALALLVCLVIGLGLQYRGVQMEARRRVDERAQQELTRLAVAHANEIADRVRSGTPLSSVAAAWMAAPSANRVADSGGLLVFDNGERLVAAVGPLAAVDTVRVEWITDDRAASDGGRTVSGKVRIADGLCVGAMRQIQDGLGRVVAYRPASQLAAEVELVTAGMPAFSGILVLWTLALFSIATYMLQARAYEKVRRDHQRSTAESLRRAQSLSRTQDSVIFGLARLAESRDAITGAHLERISSFCTALTKALRRDSKYVNVVTPGFERLIGLSAALHDIGKVGVKDDILLKPAKLTATERAIMQSHTVIGGNCLREIEQKLGSSNFLQMAREIAFAHHEWWDGTGYPYGIAGEAIPLCARIVAIADVYDALASARPYKRARSHEHCMAVIRSRAGTQFDPELVRVTVAVEHEFQDIARKYSSPLRASHETTAAEVLDLRLVDDMAGTADEVDAAVAHAS